MIIISNVSKEPKIIKAYIRINFEDNYYFNTIIN